MTVGAQEHALSMPGAIARAAVGNASRSRRSRARDACIVRTGAVIHRRRRDAHHSATGSIEVHRRAGRISDPHEIGCFFEGHGQATLRFLGPALLGHVPEPSPESRRGRRARGDR